MPSFFFCELQLSTVLLLICNFYTSWSTWFISLKLCVGLSIFHSVSFFINFYILVHLYSCSAKSMDSLTLKRHNKSFQNKNNRKATHSFAPRPLIFKLQQKAWKFNDISAWRQIFWIYKIKVLSTPPFLNCNF